MSMPDALATILAQMTQSFIATRTKVGFILTQLKAHLTDVKNPHYVDKFDIGLSKVQNQAPANEAQARAGRNNNTVMSPKRVDQYMDAKVYTPLTVLFEDAISKLDD